MEKEGLPIVRQIYGRSATDDLNDLDVNTAVWGIFMNVTLQAAVHLGPSNDQNLRFTKNKLLWNSFPSDWKVDRGSERIQKSDHDWSPRAYVEIDDFTVWQSFWDYESQNLCLRRLGAMSDQPVEAWKNQIQWYLENRHLKDLNRIDGEPMEFEWNIFPGFTKLGILEEIQKIMTELQCEPEQFKRQDHLHVNVQRLCTERTRKRVCYSCELCSQSPARTLGPGSEKKWYRTFSGKPDGDWDETAERMMLNLAESSHPIFRATSALKEDYQAKERERRLSISTVVNSELVLRTVIFCKSAQYLRSSSSVCRELSKHSKSFREMWCNRIFGNSGNSCRTSGCWSSHRRRVAGKLAARLWTKIGATSWRPENIETVLRRWSERTIIHHTWWGRRTKWSEESMSRVYITSKWRSIPSERVDSRKHENRPGLGCEGLSSSRTLRQWNIHRVSVSRRQTFLGSTCEWN